MEPQGHIDIRVTLRARLVTRRVEEQPWMQTNKESIRKREVGMRCLGHASISMEVVATLQVREKRWPNVSGGCSNAPGQKDQTIT